jgi:hypothetical protein
LLPNYFQGISGFAKEGTPPTSYLQKLLFLPQEEKWQKYLSTEAVILNSKAFSI